MIIKGGLKPSQLGLLILCLLSHKNEAKVNGIWYITYLNLFGLITRRLQSCRCIIIQTNVGSLLLVCTCSY